MGRKQVRTVADEGPPGAPEWVVTFTDMISLLVTFFVLLMTFSSLNHHDLLRVDSFLWGGIGVAEDRGSAPTAPEKDLIAATDLVRGAQLPHVRPPEELEESLVEMGQRATSQHLEVDFERMPDGLLIEFGREASFAPGSAELPAGLRAALAEIGRVLEHYPHLVVVEGFTDGRSTPSPRFPTAEALSFARAEAAAQALLEESGMVPELLQVAGRGAAAPRGDEGTARGRELDRRVQLRVLSLSRSLAQHYEGVLRPAGRGER